MLLKMFDVIDIFVDHDLIYSILLCSYGVQ